jgi:hypothetical protein
LRCSSSLGQLDSRVGLCAWCVARSWVGCVVWTVVTALYIHVDRVALRDSKRRSNDIAHPATARKRRGQPPNINTEWGPPCACGNCGTGAGRRREPRVRARAAGVPPCRLRRVRERERTGAVAVPAFAVRGSTVLPYGFIHNAAAPHTTNIAWLRSARCVATPKSACVALRGPLSGPHSSHTHTMR